MMTQHVPWHAIDADVAASRAAIDAADPLAARAATLARLAWMLRESAPAEALERAAAALAASRQPDVRARALAAEAWALAQIGDLDAALHSIAIARRGVPRGSDAVLAGDIELVASQLHLLDGAQPERAAALDAARSRYAAAGATARSAIADVLDALADHLREPAATAARWRGAFPPGAQIAEPDRAALVLTYEAGLHFAAAEFGAAARLYQQAAARACDCGMGALRQLALVNVASCLMMLGDRRGAIEELERSIEACQSAGLVVAEASSRTWLAMALLTIDRIDAAREALRQCEAPLTRRPRGRHYVRYCLTRAELHKATREWADATAWSRKARAGAAAGGWHDQAVRALYVLAQAGANQGDAGVVVAAIDEALAEARAAADRVIEAWIQATLGRAHVLVELPRHGGQSANQARIAGLEAALATLDAAGVHQGVANVCSDLADAWEQEGDASRALALLRRARAAERRDHDREATNRAQALELREEVQQARADAAQNAAAVALLETLGRIGRDLAAEHEPARLIDALVQRTTELLGCDRVALYRLDGDAASLSLVASHGCERAPAPSAIALDDPRCAIARVARERAPVRLEPEPADDDAGALPRSRLHACLLTGRRLLGVLSVEAERPHAFGERELLVVRALASYGAVALANADNAQALREALAAKSLFVASMGHELRTPLNAILGFAQLLDLDPQIGREQRARVAMIANSGKHLLALINDLLDLSRIEAGKFELDPHDVELHEVLAVVGDVVRVRADQRNLLYRCEIGADVPSRVVLDDTRLRQVLINLLGNAVKFTDRGSVELRVGLLRRSAARATLGFEVADSGVGIEADQLATIFDAYEQVGDKRRRTDGSGLGLAISRKLVRLMGGEISVRSAPGQGSTFAFEIDVEARADDTPPTLTTRLPCGYRGARRRVLVVDDTWAARALLVGGLTALGFDVDEAANGHEALARARDAPPDLVLMDRTMPGIDGFEATRRLRSLDGLGRLPVISVSAGTSDGAGLDAAARPDAHVPKPVLLAQLLAAVGSVLALEWIVPEPPP